MAFRSSAAIEGDVDVVDLEGNVRRHRLPLERPRCEHDHDTAPRSEGSVRGRLGIAVDRALFFATGGVAFAQFINQFNNPIFLGGFNSISTTRIGYVVGGGLEYALTTNFSLRAEYRYEDFGRYTQSPTFATATGFTATRHDTIQAATVGFSYKFESPIAAPVVARY